MTDFGRNDWNGTYHICALCALKSIELRHPKVWISAYTALAGFTRLMKDRTLLIKTAARFFLYLSDVYFQERLEGYFEGPSKSKWNNFQRNYNSSSLNLAEEPSMLSLLYHSIKTAPMGLQLTPSGLAGSNYGMQAFSWPVAEVQPHSRALWISIVAGLNPQTISRGDRVRIDHVLGPLEAPLDLQDENCQCHTLHDGSSAFLLYQAIAKKLGYKLHYYDEVGEKCDVSSRPSSQPKRQMIDYSKTLLERPSRRALAFFPVRTFQCIFAILAVGILLGLMTRYGGPSADDTTYYLD